MVVINIDTGKDSKEEIRKTIRYLQTLVEDEPGSASDFTNLFGENDSPGSERGAASGGMMGMFDNPFAPDDDPSAASLPDASDDDSRDGSGLSGDAEKDSGDDDGSTFVEIVEY